jgi:hypothetical protein
MALDFHNYPRVNLPESAIAPQGLCLSPREFDSLLNSLQLLRISQLRYVVHHFSIPVSGNKTKLLGLVISIFHSLRYEPVLVDVFAEISRLLEHHSDIFSSPTPSLGRLEIVPPDPSFWAPLTPLYVNADPPFLFGPLFIPPGQFGGKFSFFIPPLRNSATISFLFPDGEPQRFAFTAELNGFDLQIEASDPFPTPMDVTTVLTSDKTPNTLEIKLIASSAPMMICVREFRFIGILVLAEQVCGRKVHMSEQITVAARGCEAHDRFDLLDFLSSAVGTGRWACPVCHRPVELGQLGVARAVRADAFEPLPAGLFAPGSDPECEWGLF